MQGKLVPATVQNYACDVMCELHTHSLADHLYIRD